MFGGNGFGRGKEIATVIFQQMNVTKLRKLISRELEHVLGLNEVKLSTSHMELINIMDINQTS